MEADAPLVGAKGVVVLHAVALEQLPAAVVHPHRAVDHDLVLRLAQDQLQPVRHVQRVGRLKDGADCPEVEIVLVVVLLQLLEDLAGGLRCGGIAGVHPA